MEITEVKIYPKDDDDKKLRAFATITFDHSFVVRDIKIIEGTKGLFVAMPSRRVREPCSRCRHRNVVRSHYCNQCGDLLPAHTAVEAAAQQSAKQSSQTADKAADLARQSEHRDVAHPITVECREHIQKAVLEAYEREKVRL